MQYTDRDLKILISRTDDAVRQSETAHRNCYIGFLNEQQQFDIDNHLKSVGFKSFAFYGGCENTLRNYLCIFPTDKEFDSTKVPISAIRFTYRKADILEHKDFLGAVIALGITRESIGDIVISSGKTIMFVSSSIADFVNSQVSKIGSRGVITEILTDTSDVVITREFEELNIIISSQRVDNVVASITGLSRDKTAKLILSGDVYINYSQMQNVSYSVKKDDVLTIRKYGKYIINDNLGSTKKGRTRLSVNKFR